MTGPARRGRFFASLSVALGLAAALLAVSAVRPAAPETGPGARHDGFETSDVRTTTLGLVMIIGVATIAVSIVALFALLGIAHRQDAAGPRLTPQQTAAIAPPGPPLQSNPLGDIAALRQRESAELGAYRWLSPERRAAKIPIERAMALLVGRSLAPVSPRAVP